MPKAKSLGWILSAYMLSACVNSSPSFVTADEAGNSLTKISADGNRQTIPLTVAPHNVQASTDGKLLLATGMMDMTAGAKNHSSAMMGELLVIDTDYFNSEAVRYIPLGEHLAHVVTNKSAEIAYITDSANNRVAVLDIASGKVLNWIRVGAFPHGIRLNSVKGEFYTANLKDNTISIVDIASNKETKRIIVGKMPIQVAVSPDGAKLYVTLAKDTAVAVIDLQTRKKTKTIKVDNTPAQIYADSLGRYMYVANQGSKTNSGNTLSVIDIATDKIIKIIHTGNMPHGVVASSDGQFVYVTNMADNSVSKIDANSFEVLQTYAVGKLPNGITLIESEK